MYRFSVTYEIVTQESAEHGDHDEIGFIVQEESFREAFASVQETRTNRVGGIASMEADNGTADEDSRWLTIGNAMEYETGAYESRSFHFPESLSGASRVRIARLLGFKVKR